MHLANRFSFEGLHSQDFLDSLGDLDFVPTALVIEFKQIRELYSSSVPRMHCNSGRIIRLRDLAWWMKSLRVLFCALILPSMLFHSFEFIALKINVVKSCTFKTVKLKKLTLFDLKGTSC